MLFGQDGPDKADQGVAVGEDAHDIGPSADLAVQSFLGVVGPDLPPQLLGERSERQHVGPGRLEVIHDGGQLVGQRVEYAVELVVHRGCVGLVVDRVSRVRTHGQLVFGVTP